MKNGKVVLITGASSGIGQVCAMYLAKRGYWVFGTSRHSEIAEVSGNSQSGKLGMMKLDVNSDLSVRQAIKLIMEKAGRLDVLVNNAGIGIAGSIENTTSQLAKLQFETNFFGLHRMIKETLPIMREQGGGLIVNISSLGGLIGLPFQGFYSATKFAVEGLTEALRIEVKPFGIKVVLIEPGDFQTGFTEHRLISDQVLNDPAYQERFKRALKAAEDSEKNGDSPEKIAHLLERIIKTNSPKLRYKIGPSSKLVALSKFVPQRVSEFAVRSSFKLL